MSMLPGSFHNAVQDFHSARQRASIQEVLARITGKSTKLLSYDDVAEKLKLRARSDRGVQNVPLDAIVGSVSRYTDFTRTFLPRRDDDRERWARVKSAMETGGGVPPIDVYKVDDVYFVIDGNHRVSIARREGLKTIEAHVIEVQTEVPLTPDIQPDDLIVKAEYARFLKETRIKDLRPNVDLSITIPGQYEKLIEQIYEAECRLEKEAGDKVTFQDAVAAWYDDTYLPLAETIRDRGLLRSFPGRTITDLYIWISENRAALEQELGWEIQSDVTATDLILTGSARSRPGAWRESRTVSRYTDRLFADILVPLSGYAESWDALDQAILIARQERATLHGLHVVDAAEDLGSPDAIGIKARFDQTCQTAGVRGHLAIDVGDITPRICERAVATDLIVMKIANPPSTGISAFESPFRKIIQRSSRPLIAVPGAARQFARAVLAFDGSDRAKEALFVATYLAEVWKTELIVLTALEGERIGAETQDYARRYLEIHEVEAEFILSDRKAAVSLNNVVEERDADLVLMGSHGGPAIAKLFVGSHVDSMMRQSGVPLFICR